MNTIGSYSCQCGTGLEKFKDFNLEYQKVETKCRDIDECQGVNEYQGMNICPRNSVCQNTEATYSCLCLPGYDGEKCSDVDECSSGIAKCNETTQCFNIEGFYE